MSFLPRRKQPAALEDHSGRQFTAEARLSVDAAGLIRQIEDALKTADHILMRLSEPTAQTHWADTPRLAMMWSIMTKQQPIILMNCRVLARARKLKWPRLHFCAATALYCGAEPYGCVHDEKEKIQKTPTRIYWI